MLRRIWNMLVRLVRSLFASAPDPRESEKAARRGHEDLLARVTDARGRVQTIQEQLEHAVASSRGEVADLLDEARRLVEAGREDAARMVLHRRQATLDRIRILDGQLARVTLEDQALASASDRLESEIAVRSARQGVSAARYDAAEARAKVTEALTDVSEEFSDLLAELRDADERAEYMESRADALDELVEIGVLSSHIPLPQTAGEESYSEEVEMLLGQMRHSVGSECCPISSSSLASSSGLPLDLTKQYRDL